MDFFSVKNSLESLLDVFFPRQCFGCGRRNDFLCKACLAAIPRVARIVPFTEQDHRTMTALEGVWVLAEYDAQGVLARCIKALKYKSAKPLAERLGEALGQELSLATSFPKPQESVWVPVPLHPRRERERGFNQAHALAITARSVFKDHPLQESPPLLPLLQRVRYTEPQAHLARKERLFNLSNAFSICSKIPLTPDLLNKKFVLFDDVCTTGSTLNECAKALKGAGAKEVWGVVLARAV